ncbi:T9SS type A sorting domain-containing protein [bacterium]|nr:T9SS type A sorting domain-containing protein [bacterium]
MRKLIGVFTAVLMLGGVASADWGMVEGVPFWGQLNEIQRLPSGGLLLGTTGGLYYSMDDGSSWTHTGIGTLDENNAGNDVPFDALERPDGTVYIAIESVFVGTTALNDFVLADWELYGIESIEASGDTIVAASATDIYRSVDNGQNWEVAYELSPVFNDIVALYTDPTNGTFVAHLATAGGVHLIVSEDGGANWTEQQIPDVYGELTAGLFDDEGTFYFVHNYQDYGYLRSTDDYGASTSLHYTSMENRSFGALTMGEDDRFGLLENSRILVSTDGRANFTQAQNDFARPGLLMFSGNTLIAGNNEGVYKSPDDGTTWEQSNSGLDATYAEIANIDLEGNAWLVAPSRIYKETDDGVILIDMAEMFDMPPRGFTITSSGRVIVLGTASSGAMMGRYSDDEGETWEEINVPEDNGGFFNNIVETDPGTLLAAEMNLGLYRSMDDGASWSYLNNGAAGELTVAGDGTIYNTHWSGISKSTDNGENWTAVEGIGTPGPITASPTGGTVIAMDFYQAMRSTDGGENWESIQTNFSTAFEDMMFAELKDIEYDEEGNLYALVVAQAPSQGYRSLGFVLRSDDDGDTWSEVSGWSPLRHDNGLSLGLGANGSMFALTSRGMYVEEIFLTTPEDPVTQPVTFRLEQNYPNPFNPTTTIAFSLPRDQKMQLKVFDTLGREVATLVDGRRAAGAHAVTFDGSGLSSGVYFYRLESENHRVVKRMMLVK